MSKELAIKMHIYEEFDTEYQDPNDEVNKLTRILDENGYGYQIHEVSIRNDVTNKEEEVEI